VKYKNEKLVAALDIVARHADYRNDTGDDKRSLAFHKAMAALKALPFEVRKMQELSKLKDLGAHSKTIVQELLEDGNSSEVETIRNSEWFKTMEMFIGVYGAGAATAKRWFTAGHRKIQDLITSPDIVASKDQRLIYGLAFYQDLTTPLKRSEAEQIRDIVRTVLDSVLPGATLEMTGGFRRGKEMGHDADFLISHPKEGAEEGVLGPLLDRLSERGVLLFGSLHRSSYTDTVIRDDARSDNTLDHFEKWIGIFKLPSSQCHLSTDKETSNKKDLQSVCELATGPRPWRAVRVDLVVCPVTQYPYALVGWSGSKYFIRSIANYTKTRLDMKLSSHGLWDKKNNKMIAASTEQDVFKNLNLNYLEPWERNM